MAVYLLTVRSTMRTDSGLRIEPGVRPSQESDHQAVGKMTQGSGLELRTPNGSIIRTTLVTFGVSAFKGEDGSFHVPDADDPEIKFTLPGSLSDSDVPPGTEVWLLDD